MIAKGKCLSGAYQNLSANTSQFTYAVRKMDAANKKPSASK
jgi:hypothetical protein